MGNEQKIRDGVRDGYAKIASAEPGSECCGPGCCAPGSPGVSEKLGYAGAEMGVVPEGADMGLSCGNPTAIAALQPGETVVDLGSGGGLDVFLAGPRVGARGRAIGIDMTPEMLAKSRRAIEEYRARTGLDNVEFRLGEIEALPLPDACADVVISNCVINLSPEKPRVWQEIARVLKPGGRVAVSDLVLYKPLPREVAEMMESWIGCIAGASLIEDIRSMAADAGLGEVVIEEKRDYLAALESVQDPLYRRIIACLPAGEKLTDYITSANITARKIGGCRCG